MSSNGDTRRHSCCAGPVTETEPFLSTSAGAGAEWPWSAGRAVAVPTSPLLPHLCRFDSGARRPEAAARDSGVGGSPATAVRPTRLPRGTGQAPLTCPELRQHGFERERWEEDEFEQRQVRIIDDDYSKKRMLVGCQFITQTVVTATFTRHRPAGLPGDCIRKR